MCRLVPDSNAFLQDIPLKMMPKQDHHDDPKAAKIEKYIDENLKKVFSDLENDGLPDEITDLLSVLRAQDAAGEAKK